MKSAAETTHAGSITCCDSAGAAKSDVERFSEEALSIENSFNMVSIRISRGAPTMVSEWASIHKARTTTTTNI